MAFWKPHSLANPHTGQINLRIGDKVRSLGDLDGVPAGTEGKVILANGFSWLRYRVLFTNGRARRARRQAARPRGQARILTPSAHRR
jgi:hypothetical protein